MKLAERLALISAGYKKKEIDALEEIEKTESEKIEAEAETETEDKPDYKTMYEQAMAQNEELTRSISEKDSQIKEIQASNRNAEQEKVEAPNFLDTIFS